MPRIKSDNAIYAEEIGIENKIQGPRFIRRMGGAQKLRALEPEVRNILLRPSGFRDDRPATFEDK